MTLAIILHYTHVRKKGYSNFPLPLIIVYIKIQFPLIF